MLDDETTSTEELQSAEAGTSEGTTDKKPESLTEAQKQAFLDSDEYKKALQSEADKRQAAFEKRAQKEQAERFAALRRTREEEELMSLVDKEDYEGLGERTAQSIRQRKALADAASQVSGAIEGVLKEHPEYRVLGEDKINEIFDDVRGRGGSVIDFMLGLSEAKFQKQVGTYAEQTRLDTRKEMEAFLIENNLLKRSASAEDSGAISEVEQASTTTKGKLSRSEAMKAYGEGAMTTSEAEKLGLV